MFIDTNGGSWLGKTITIKPDGTHYFDNYWGDTVIIKAQAQLNDNWTLFDDTTNIYYKATVKAIDTMSILGTIDSIKKIVLTAYKGGYVLNNDPLNNVSIILSKNNGFVQICDLYIFPLHEPDTNYQRFFDYFLDQNAPSINAQPDTGAIIFHLVSNKWPISNSVYDYHTGDIFEYFLSYYPYPYQKRTLNKVINDNPLEVYQAIETSSMQGISTVVSGNINYTYPAIVQYDSILIPEEKGQYWFYYLYPNDTSYCTISDKYGFKSNNIYLNQINTFEPAFETTMYKKGFGLVYHNRIYMGETDGGELTLAYASKASNPCGTPPVLGIETLQENQINIYPNPTSDEIQIQLRTNDNYSLQMYNAVGQLVKSKTVTINKTSITVSDLANGVYYISISGEGLTYHKQLVIEH